MLPDEVLIRVSSSAETDGKIPKTGIVILFTLVTVVLSMLPLYFRVLNEKKVFKLLYSSFITAVIFAGWVFVLIVNCLERKLALSIAALVYIPLLLLPPILLIKSFEKPVE